ncbi:SDR family NAD(P)-dependent oxidoreductase [Nocardia bhagyanarayanae]|uniref:NAD(P)-dependent dehydrogenase (Short-subunit alcohol dehydrogenase family) n=1 Tax=Nocardia bhagyanarayanae TaxID=1215925 RepID=A0A543FF95_9NOCA|nr:SDR family NAD(P)-dependent oxidoreductase [Nocardia bhagyanarayanae]TQM32424.1 NAD(P)-dependent dehydrogenase (short-subunit alcohol dehydrogenase family) [Nocardia bhagyanarayanae]
MTTTTALVTGANKGLGRETVRRLAGLGWEVFLAARDPARGAETLAELAEEGVRVRFVTLDVTSDESVTAAADAVRASAGHLDVLINNAAVGGPRTHPADTRVDELREVFETNVFGPVRVTHAFLPLLRASGHPRIVMVSSGMGSIATVTDPRWKDLLPPALGYPTTKAALNMLTTRYAAALPEIRINAVDPGYTATDLNGHTGFQSVVEGTDAIVELACVDPGGPTGGFFDRNGTASW